MEIYRSELRTDPLGTVAEIAAYNRKVGAAFADTRPRAVRREMAYDTTDVLTAVDMERDAQPLPNRHERRKAVKAVKRVRKLARKLSRKMR